MPCVTTTLTITRNASALLHVREGDELRCAAGRVTLAPAAGGSDLPVYASACALECYQAWRAPQTMWVRVLSESGGTVQLTSLPAAQRGTSPFAWRQKDGRIMPREGVRPEQRLLRWLRRFGRTADDAT